VLALTVEVAVRVPSRRGDKEVEMGGGRGGGEGGKKEDNL
jgi:hypothetical protein